MKCIFFYVALFTLSMTSISCDNRETDEAKTACEQLDEQDLKMLNMIKQIQEEYKGDKPFLAALKDAQVYWTQYRNRQVKAVFPLSPNKYNYDVGECKCQIYRDMTKLRIKELQKWLDGVPSNTSCIGSYKIKK